jgi:hypothetical protein
MCEPIKLVNVLMLRTCFGSRICTHFLVVHFIHCLVDCKDWLEMMCVCDSISVPDIQSFEDVILLQILYRHESEEHKARL